MGLALNVYRIYSVSVRENNERSDGAHGTYKIVGIRHKAVKHMQ